MIDRDTVNRFHLWFDDYVGGFDPKNASQRKNLDVKAEHSRKVCAEISDVGGSIGLDGPELRFAETAALFHDVGRFEQYSRYGTFSDRHSVNHAELGIRILAAEGILEPLRPEIRETLCRVIGNHNKFAVPDGESEFCLRMSRLLRDADKLDIWRVVTEFYKDPDPEDDVIVLGLSNDPEISIGVIDDLKRGRLVDILHLRTVNDFKLMKMGWVYDLNFTRSFRILRDRRYLQTIYETLPDQPRIRRAYDLVGEFLEARCRD
jgi:hypothetical protein